jgi:hypothetical protein
MLILVDKNIGLYMDSQGQERAFNMEACWRCDKNWLSHIETGAEKHCKHRNQLFPQAVL